MSFPSGENAGAKALICTGSFSVPISFQLSRKVYNVKKEQSSQLGTAAGWIPG